MTCTVNTLEWYLETNEAHTKNQIHICITRRIVVETRIQAVGLFTLSTAWRHLFLVMGWVGDVYARNGRKKRTQSAKTMKIYFFWRIRAPEIGIWALGFACVVSSCLVEFSGGWIRVPETFRNAQKWFRALPSSVVTPRAPGTWTDPPSVRKLPYRWSVYLQKISKLWQISEQYKG